MYLFVVNMIDILIVCNYFFRVYYFKKKIFKLFLEENEERLWLGKYCKKSW